jgi:hypothetical protein
MTPLTTFLYRYLPSASVWPAVSMIYATALLLVILFGRPLGGDIIYIDLDVPE